MLLPFLSVCLLFHFIPPPRTSSSLFPGKSQRADEASWSSRIRARCRYRRSALSGQKLPRRDDSTAHRWCPTCNISVPRCRNLPCPYKCRKGAAGRCRHNRRRCQVLRLDGRTCIGSSSPG